MKEDKRGDWEEVWLLFLQMVTAQLDMAMVSLYCCNSQATLQPDLTRQLICTEQGNTRPCLIWQPVLAQSLSRGCRVCHHRPPQNMSNQIICCM